MNLRRDLFLSRKPLAGFVAIGACWAVYFAQMPVIKANVGASDGAYGAAILVAALGALAAMWLAPAARRYAGRFAVSFAIVALAVGMLGAAASGTLVGLTAALLLVSAGSGIIDVLVNARVSEIEEKSQTSLMNLNHALYSFAYAGCALATGALRTAGWGPVAIVAALAGVLLVLALVSTDRGAAADGGDAQTKTALPYVLVVLTGLIVMMAFLAEAASEGWSALHLERTLGGSAAEGAMGPALLALMMGTGRLSGHWLSAVIRDTRLMLLATLVSAGGILLAGLAGVVWVALLGFAIAGLGISVVAPLALALIGRSVPADIRLAAISRASVLGYGAFFFGPPLMGLVAQGFGLPTAFILIAVLLVMTATVLIPALARRVA